MITSDSDFNMIVNSKLLFQCCRYRQTLRGKCPYSEFFWSVFPRIRPEYGPEKLQIRTLEYLSVFSLNMGKYEPQKLKYGLFSRSESIIICKIIKGKSRKVVHKIDPCGTPEITVGSSFWVYFRPFLLPDNSSVKTQS